MENSEINSDFGGMNEEILEIGEKKKFNETFEFNETNEFNETYEFNETFKLNLGINEIFENSTKKN